MCRISWEKLNNPPQETIDARNSFFKECENKCSVCKGDINFKINFISGMNCTSSYATFDLGRTNNIKFCPECGRRL
jgi:hypothetical protein